VRITTDDGVALEARVTGPAGAPALLLVHGFGGAKEDFDDHVDHLARGRRVVTFDHRGHGESDQPEDPAAYTIDRFAADVLAVANAVGAATFDLLGHSLGGFVAQRVVLGTPERVDRLVLMDTAPCAPAGVDRSLAEAAADIVRTGGLAALAEAMADRDPLTTPAHERLIAERPGFAEFSEKKFFAQSPVMYAAMILELVDQPDQLPRLPSVTCPTLVIVGDQDRPFLDASRAMAAAIPGARLVVVPDAGHSPQFENPDAWRNALDGFLGATSR